MKTKAIRFFSPEDNLEKTEKVAEKAKPTGYISVSGKIVLPTKTLEETGINPENTKFRIGTQEGKRKLKALYLVPDNSGAGDTFEVVRSGRGYVIPLALILKKGGIDFNNSKVIFTISSFEYSEGVTGFELEFTNSEEKPEYTGKKRGRKPKAVVAE